MKTPDALAALSALANESRLAAFRALVGAGRGGMHAGDLATQLALPSSTLSFHLKHLASAGLVTCDREGRSLRYRAAFERVVELTAYLTDHCCAGNPELCLPNGVEGSLASAEGGLR